MLLDSTDGELYSGWGTYQQVGHVEIIGLENVFDYTLSYPFLCKHKYQSKTTSLVRDIV